MKIHKFEFNPFGELTYVVWDPATGQGAVVDPGMSSQWEQNLFDKFIADNGIRLRYLLYTHLHIDHTLGHEHIVRTYGVESYAAEADAPLGIQRAAQARMFNLPIAPPQALTIDIPLTDGQILPLGNESLQTIFVPGHSQGSVAYYCRQSGFVLTGDALFSNSIGRTDLPGGNYAQLIKSITNRLLTLPPDTTVYPGHGPSTTIRREAQTNPYL